MISSLRATALALLAAPSLTAQVEIYTNGPVASHPDGGPNNAPTSRVQTLGRPSMQSLGYVMSFLGQAVADDFAVAGTMFIDEIEVFVIAENAQTPTTLGDLRLAIWDGDPRANPTQLIAGAGLGIDLLTAPGFGVRQSMTGVFRVEDTNLQDSTKQIQSIRVALPNQLQLTTGTYWLGWNASGATFPPPIAVPPLTIENATTTGNAIKRNRLNGWQPIENGDFSNGGPFFGQGLPFRFFGNPVVPLGFLANAGGGCGGVSLSVQGAPVPGGFLRIELGNTRGVTGLVLAANAPTTATPTCPCRLVGGAFATLLGASLDLQIPTAPALYGTPTFVQGFDLQPFAACRSGAVGFELSDAFEISL